MTSSASPLLPGKVSQKTGVPKDAVAASEDYAFSLKIDDIKCHLVRQCCLVKGVAKTCCRQHVCGACTSL